MHSKKNKNHAFINVFSKKKIPKFCKCIFLQKKKIHSNIHHICIQKNYAFIKAFFFSEKNILNMQYICIKKNHVFISAYSEKIHALIYSNMHFSKKKVQNFIMHFVKKNLSFQKKRKKRKMWWVICSWIIEFTIMWIVMLINVNNVNKWDSFKQNVNKGKS